VISTAAEVLRRVAACGAPAQPTIAEWREPERRRLEEFTAAPAPVAAVGDAVVPAGGAAIRSQVRATT
jgi:hypothetical protein